MSNVTVLAEGLINGHDAVTIHLVEADNTPAAVIIQWPAKASVLHPRRFPDGAAKPLECSLPRPHGCPRSGRERGL